MAEKKNYYRKSAPKEAAPAGHAGGLRAGAVILWIAAIAFEMLAVLSVDGTLGLSPVLWLILFLIFDLICLVAGSQLWRKANVIEKLPPEGTMKYRLFNNMGVIVAALAFVPFILISLGSKNADGKTKLSAGAAALIAAAAIVIILVL